MAASAVQIASNALLMLGAEPINDFDDESDRATLASNLWDQVQDAVLRMHPWNCAVKRVQLAPDASSPAFDYAYQFTLPGDLLRVLAVGEEGDTPRYKVEGRKILADDAALNLRYIYRNTNIPHWDSLLVHATTAAMAEAMAYPLTKSNTTQQSMAAKLDFWMRQARTVDALEEPTDDVGDFPLLNVRR